MSDGFINENSSLMSEVRGEWVKVLKMIETYPEYDQLVFNG